MSNIVSGARQNLDENLLQPLSFAGDAIPMWKVDLLLRERHSPAAVLSVPYRLFTGKFFP
jgi:hypothetical protein